MLQTIVQWATNEEAIRCILLIGSRATNKNSSPLADYDLSIFTNDNRPYTESEVWLSKIGKVWVSVNEQVILGKSVFPSRLVIFEKGVKVDFTFFPLETLRFLANEPILPPEYDLGYIPLIDKDTLAIRLPPPSFSCHKSKLPPEDEFVRLVKEFWFEAYHIAVYLKRGQLWKAKFRAGNIHDNFLLKMIEWRELINKDEAKRSVPLNGQDMHSWVNADIWNALHQVFAHFEAKDSWKCLLELLLLFRTISKETAKELKYFYPQSVDTEITNFIQKLYKEDNNW